MKTVLATRYIDIPEGVKVDVKSRVVSVEGPRGSLTRNFKHLNLDIQKADGGKKLRVDLWFGNRKQLACIRTVCSHIENLITGVTKGFLYKMRFCYAHFPINVTLTDRTVEIRNFLGEKRVRRVVLCDGVDYVRSTTIKDQIELSGNDIADVSNMAARISQACTVKNKDIRKFLDGIYVSEKTNIVQEEA
ncbi:ribosomal protein L6, alpha-beta domain-containing protein [Tribonema minus]|uniref:Ribosomal protein L6, alpha-beta domain-containing protein n=1 Tax=Tribonema minus TaxID=303371 RepID=A0A836CAK5_9STRA|nr:ribosomal protein L6, alpha-beta domain-containing protein [Tribonema minus]